MVTATRLVLILLPAKEGLTGLLKIYALIEISATVKMTTPGRSILENCVS